MQVLLVRPHLTIGAGGGSYTVPDIVLDTTPAWPCTQAHRHARAAPLHGDSMETWGCLSPLYKLWCRVEVCVCHYLWSRVNFTTTTSWEA